MECPHEILIVDLARKIGHDGRPQQHDPRILRRLFDT